MARSTVGIALFGVAAALAGPSTVACSSTSSALTSDGGAHDATKPPSQDGGHETDAPRADGHAADAREASPDAGPDAHAAAPDAASDASAGGDSGTAGLTKVGGGEYETFYLVNGDIYGYGATAGLLGEGSFTGMSIPARPIASPAGVKFVDVQAGLHQTMAIDTDGDCWTWGEVDQGLQGSGADAGNDSAQPYKITTDANGNPFTGIVGIEATVANADNEMQYDIAWKSDGTVWAWGNLTNGLMGNGTAGQLVGKPTQIPLSLPAGVKIIKVLGSSAIFALASDGSVWAWGTTSDNTLGTGMTGATDGYTPQKVLGLPTDIVDIAVGYGTFQYALTSTGVLWGWGYRGGYLGIGSNDAGVYLPTPAPVSLEAALNLPSTVVAVACDFMTTHVILADGSLWGWGDNAMGLVGDGHELDYANATPPYAWDFGAFDLPVWKPVRIAPTVSNFVKVFAHSPFIFYDYALTSDGKLYSWGRNKTGTLGNGVYPEALGGNTGVTGQMEATYPNSWDVTVATLVSPLTVTPVGVNSPYCVVEPDAGGCR